MCVAAHAAAVAHRQEEGRWTVLDVTVATVRRVDLELGMRARRMALQARRVGDRLELGVTRLAPVTEGRMMLRHRARQVLLMAPEPGERGPQRQSGHRRG